MFRHIETEAVVLNRGDYKEQDRLYTVLSRDFGKMSLFSRSGKKMTAKLAPHLESFAVCKVNIVIGKVHNVICGVDRLENFSNLSKFLTTSLLARHGLRLIELGTRNDQQDRELYKSAVDWLRFLNSCGQISDERAGILLGSFAIKLFAILGYKPELFICLGCKKNINMESAHCWHSLRGGVVCSSCAHDSEANFIASKQLGTDALDLARNALTKDFSELLLPTVRGATILEFHEMIESLIVSHFPAIPSNTLRASCLA